MRSGELKRKERIPIAPLRDRGDPGLVNRTSLPTFAYYFCECDLSEDPPSRTVIACSRYDSTIARMANATRPSSKGLYEITIRRPLLVAAHCDSGEQRRRRGVGPVEILNVKYYWAIVEHQGIRSPVNAVSHAA